jgi:hypothetical protein
MVKPRFLFIVCWSLPTKPLGALMLKMSVSECHPTRGVRRRKSVVRVQIKSGESSRLKLPAGGVRWRVAR